MKILDITQGSKEWLDLRRTKLKFNTRQEGECWIWNGSSDKDGYGNCGHGYPSQRAHRASYILFKGQIPKGLWVLHKCDKPGCINPEHLYLGDCKQNVKDAMERGLFPRGLNPKKACKGERNCKAKLTENQVREMRKLYSPRKFGFHRLAKMFGVDKHTVLRAVKGETWACVS